MPLLADDWKISIHYPGIFFGAIFGMGVFASAYWFGKFCHRMGKNVMTYVKSMNNSSKYLSTTLPSNAKESYSAVIYGANTKAGRIYAHFLA